MMVVTASRYIYSMTVVLMPMSELERVGGVQTLLIDIIISRLGVISSKGICPPKGKGEYEDCLLVKVGSLFFVYAED